MNERPIGRQLADTIWPGGFDISSFPARRFRQDLQGWNSEHIYLREAIETIKPKLVVEIGVWKGGSTLHMARVMREQGLDAVVVAVDTWLGSWEHWEQPRHFADLLFDHGYPSLYYTFLTNVAESGLKDYVVPLPLDSANAAFVLKRKGLSADVVHIDGGHDFDAVLADMKRWWEVLRPGGLLILDDYDAAGVVWPTVREAVDHFRAATPHVGFEALPYKARLSKPV